MDSRGLGQKRKDWIYVLIVISIISVYTYWYLSLHPQHISLFLTLTIIVLGFVALMTLIPKYRRRLLKRILAYHTKQKEVGGWLYRYQRIGLILFFITILIFPLLSQYQLIESQYMPWVTLAFFITILASASIQMVGLLKVAGKWGLLLILILALIAALRIWT